jgi:hypothetical protein
MGSLAILFEQRRLRAPATGAFQNPLGELVPIASPWVLRAKAVFIASG